MIRDHSVQPTITAGLGIAYKYHPPGPDNPLRCGSDLALGDHIGFWDGVMLMPYSSPPPPISQWDLAPALQLARQIRRM